MLSIPPLIQRHQPSSKRRDAAAGPWKGWGLGGAGGGGGDVGGGGGVVHCKMDG